MTRVAIFTFIQNKQISQSCQLHGDYSDEMVHAHDADTNKCNLVLASDALHWTCAPVSCLPYLTFRASGFLGYPMLRPTYELTLHRNRGIFTPTPF